MSNSRTDVHAPKNLVTEDYDYLGSGYFGSPGEPGYSPIQEPYAQKLLNEGWHFAENESAGSCYHCGAHLKYYAILLHNPTHTFIRVGETCLGNRFERSSADFHALRKAAQLNRQQHRLKDLRLCWFACDEDREVAFAWASEQVTNGNYGWEGLYHKFVHTVNRYGDASDKMVRFVMRNMAREERIAEERAAERKNLRPVVEGKGTITGTVISRKYQENDFGGKTVMTVKDDRGFLVWGTVPRSLMDIPNLVPYDRQGDEIVREANLERHVGAISGTYYLDLALEAQARLDADDGSMVQDGERFVEVGERVTFNATVEKSDRGDESFGFFKRPTKATLLPAEEV